MPDAEIRLLMPTGADVGELARVSPATLFLWLGGLIFLAPVLAWRGMEAGGPALALLDRPADRS